MSSIKQSNFQLIQWLMLMFVICRQSSFWSLRNLASFHPMDLPMTRAFVSSTDLLHHARGGETGADVEMIKLTFVDPHSIQQTWQHDKN